MENKKILALYDWSIKEIDKEDLKRLLQKNPDVFKFESKDWSFEFWNFDDWQVRPLLKSLLRVNRIQLLSLAEKLKLFAYWWVVLALFVMSYFIYQNTKITKTLYYQKTSIENKLKSINTIQKQIQDTNTKITDIQNKIQNNKTDLDNIKNILLSRKTILKNEQTVNVLLYKKLKK